MKMIHFLMVFDHDRGKLIKTEKFDDSDEAVIAYAQMEDLYAASNRIEVVLIGSDSLETVKITHANYFDGSVALSNLFAGI